MACVWFELVAATSVSFGLPASMPSWNCWRPVNKDGVPALQDAVAAGKESGIPLYACRAVVKGDTLVGRLRPDFGGCHIGYGGHELEVTSYEVLSLSWTAAKGTLPPDSLIAGTKVAEHGQEHFETMPLAPCRAAYADGIHSGQTQPLEPGCSFGFGGKQVVAQTYDVLRAAPWLTWTVAVARNLPDDAVVSGSEDGAPVYLCRASDDEGLHPGKIRKVSLGCSIVSNGREAVVDRFEVLVPKWGIASAGTFPLSAFPVGSEGNATQFVCRAQSQGAVQLGRMSSALDGCHVGMEGGETVFRAYEVLTQ